MNRTKEDKQFMIQFDQENRNFLTNNALITLTLIISITALFASIYSIVFSISGFNRFSMVLMIIFVLALIPTWVLGIKNVKRDIRNAKRVNIQLQNELYKLYPEYKKKYR